MKKVELFLLGLIAHVFIFLPIEAISQTRNTLWLDGLSTTSLGWDNTSNQLRDLAGYDLFNVISLQGLPSSVYQPETGIFEAGNILESNLAEFENILGFGHDFGGLVLRGIANGSNNLSAVVLNGVPNLGSNGIKFAIESTGVNGLSEAQRIINGVKAIKSGEDCEDCTLVETFETWISELKANEDIFSQMTPNSTEINALNQEDNLPQIPHVNFYGTKNNLSITSLMSSWYFPNTGNDDHFSKCYAEQLERQRESAEDEFLRSVIGNTLGFFGDVVGFLGKIIKDPGSAPNILSVVSSYISESKDFIIKDIEATKKRDEELGRILRCEIANQLLATEWQLALVENGTFETELVTFVPSYNECLDICNAEGWEDFYLEYTCIPDCLNETHTQTVFIADTNDGLLLKSEQLLPGSVKNYHLRNTNHFQETDLGYGELHDHFQDLFDGAAGSAFVIPN